MVRCWLFGHKWPYEMTFFPEPPKGRRMLEKALAYEACERCHVVQMRYSTLKELIRRIERSRELVWKPQ